MARAGELPAACALMGWIALALVGGAGFGLLVLLGLPRLLWTFAGAALMLGAIGYARQGRPELAGRPTAAAKIGGEVDPVLSELRRTLFGAHTVAEPYFVGADALIRSGAKASAVNLLLSGVANDPANPALWSTLGQAYVAHDGTLSPAARFAFTQAMRVAPEHPGPPFFLGMALVEEDRLEDAQRWWARAYRLCPPGTVYRREIGLRLQLLDRFLAEQRGRGAR